MMARFLQKFTVFTIFAKSSAIDLLQSPKYDILCVYKGTGLPFRVKETMQMLELYSYFLQLYDFILIQFNISFTLTH